MKKIISGLVSFAIIFSSISKVNAIDFVPSSSELRFSAASPTQTFTVTLSDNIEKFAGKNKTIKAKLKVKKKYFETNLEKNTIEIPVVNGEVGTSQDITITLKNPESYEESFSQKFKIKAKKKLAKKAKLKALKDDLFVDIGSIQVSGLVSAVSGGSSSSSNNKGRIINPLNNPGVVTIEIHRVNEDGTIDSEILASVQSNPDGSFTIDLPDGETLGTNIVLVVPELGYQIFPTKSTGLELDPINHFVTKEILEREADPNFNPVEGFEALLESLADQIKLIGANLDEEDLDSLLTALDALFSEFIDNLLVGMEDGSSYCTDPENDDLSDHELAAKELGNKDYNLVMYRSELGGSTSANTFFDEKRVGEAFEFGGLDMSRPDCRTGLITIAPKFFGTAAAELIKFDHFDEEGDGLEPFNNDLPDFCEEGTVNFDEVECQAFHDSHAGGDHNDDLPDFCQEGNANFDQTECQAFHDSNAGDHICHDAAGQEIECEEEGHETCFDPETGNAIECQDEHICHNDAGEETECPEECHDPATGAKFECGEDFVCHDEAGDEIECPGECVSPAEDEIISCEEPICEEGEECEHICTDDAGQEFPCNEGPGKDDFFGDDSCHILHAFNHEFRGQDGEHPFYASVDEFNVISLIEPSEEEEEEHDVDEDFKIVGREKDSSKKLFPVGDSVYLGTLSGGHEAYTQDGTTQLFDDNELGFITVVDKGGVDIAEVNKTYGVVSISTDLGDTPESDGRIELQNYIATLTLNSGAATLSGTGSQIEINSVEVEATNGDVSEDKDCCNYELTTELEEFSQSGSIKSGPNGNFIELNLTDADEVDDDEAPLTGFANPDASILFFLTADDRNVDGGTPEPGDSAYDKGRINTAAREYTVAVELGTPSINGNTYYILSYDKYINDKSGIGLMSSNRAVTPTISFGASTATVPSITYTDVARATCDSAITTTESTTVVETPSYTMETNGKISVTIAGRPLEGYVSADGSLIALHALDTSTNKQSMYLLVKQEAAVVDQE